MVPPPRLPLLWGNTEVLPRGQLGFTTNQRWGGWEMLENGPDLLLPGCYWACPQQTAVYGTLCNG